MDRLQHWLEDLESPTCPNCGTEMRLCCSELIRFVPATNLLLFKARPGHALPSTSSQLLGYRRWPSPGYTS